DRHTHGKASKGDRQGNQVSRQEAHQVNHFRADMSSGKTQEQYKKERTRMYDFYVAREKQLKQSFKDNEEQIQKRHGRAEELNAEFRETQLARIELENELKG